MSTAPHTGSMDTTGTLVVSQPMYFPWVGMLEQIRLCDTYVFYDDHVEQPVLGVGGGGGEPATA